jgi:caffeoyl-CoA O-methyltransferase
MDRLLEQYITGHSTPPDSLLEELYRETHIRFINPNMVSGHLQGLLLELISKMIQPESILEIGTFTGYSAICLARGLKKGGKLLTMEINDELESFSRGYFERAGLSGSIEQISGRAQAIIPELKGMFDLVFIDGDKREYCEYFRLVKDKVKKGGFILADNVLWGGKALENDTKDQQSKGIIEFNEMLKNEPGIENLILPLRDGLMIIRKL